MDSNTLAAILTDPLTGTLLTAMVVVALADFLIASVARLRDGTFSVSQWGRWTSNKGIAVVAVAVLYALDQAAGQLTLLGLGAPFTAFGLVAAAMAVTFIVTETSSVFRNLRSSVPLGEPILDEAVGA